MINFQVGRECEYVSMESRISEVLIPAPCVRNFTIRKYLNLYVCFIFELFYPLPPSNTIDMKIKSY